jgi:hypothetical protein
MDSKVEDIIIEELAENKRLLLDLVQRVSKIEVKYSWVAGIWGTLGGMLAALLLYLAKG